MEARPFELFDYPMIEAWYLAQMEPCPPIDLLPKNGFVVEDICAGFLYLTDSRLGIIDCYISNPEISKDLRDKALNLVTLSIIDKAKDYKCRVLIATSNVAAVKRRTELHGFKYVCENSVYSKEI
jgi:hypothetical protein